MKSNFQEYLLENDLSDYIFKDLKFNQIDDDTQKILKSIKFDKYITQIIIDITKHVVIRTTKDIWIDADKLEKLSKYKNFLSLSYSNKILELIFMDSGDNI